MLSTGRHLHSVLALDPARNVGAPGQGSHKAAQDVVPLDPFAASNGTRFLLQKTGLVARVGADRKKGKTDHAQDTRGHLGHDGSKNLGRRVFALPVGVFGHVQGKRRILSNKGSRGAHLRSRDKGLGRGELQATRKKLSLDMILK